MTITITKESIKPYLTPFAVVVAIAVGGLGLRASLKPVPTASLEHRMWALESNQVATLNNTVVLGQGLQMVLNANQAIAGMLAKPATNTVAKATNAVPAVPSK